MCFRCGLEDHLIEIFLKPDTPENKVHWNMEDPKTRIYISTKIYKTSDNIIYQNYSHKIYMSMAYMYSNAKIPRIYF